MPPSEETGPAVAKGRGFLEGGLQDNNELGRLPNKSDCPESDFRVLLLGLVMN